MSKVEITLEIEDEYIKRIKWKGGKVDSEIYIEDLLPPFLSNCFRLAVEQVEPKWDKDSLLEFIKSRTNRQKAVIKILANESEWITKEALANKVGVELGQKIKPHNLAGPIGGITNRINSLEKDYFIQEDWALHNNAEKKLYLINPEYKGIIIEIIKELGDEYYGKLVST